MDMTGLSLMAIGVLTLVVAFTIIPIVGSELDSAVSIPANSSWNSSYNADIPTGADLWASVGGILKVGGIVVVVAGFLKTLTGLRNNGA